MKKEKRKVTSWGHEDPWGRQVIGGLIDEMIGTSFCCCSSSCWARWCGSRDWPAPSRRRRDAPSVTSNRAASDATADPTRRRANPWRIELRYSVAGNWNITNNWIQLLDSITGFNYWIQLELGEEMIRLLVQRWDASHQHLDRYNGFRFFRL